MCICQFCVNMSYVAAVILPTVWLYLDTRFHASTYFLGFVLSAFSVAGLLAGPLLGR